jgi:hypothetical protein
VIGDRYPHPGIPAVPGNVGTGDPGPDNDEIILLLHNDSSVATEPYKGLPGESRHSTDGYPFEERNGQK